MNVRVIGTGDGDAWLDVLSRLPGSDVYFRPEYHRACELNGDGEARAFVAERGRDLLFHPFLLRRIGRVGSEPVAEECYDLESVYGYAGPLASSDDPAFLAAAWQSFRDWCGRSRVVAEFIRFNPFLENTAYADASCDIRFARESVIVSLQEPEAELWESSAPAHRNKVRRALESGLVCSERSGTDAFRTFSRLYRETMERLQAPESYYFSDRYFDHLRTSAPERTKLFATVRGDETVAAGLFLLDGDRIHYHLSGSRPAGRRGANNLLLHTVAGWGRERGLGWLHLGGGRTADPSDSLLRFKAALSPLRRPVYVGTRVHDPAAYERLCAAWLRQHPEARGTSYFLLYRLEPG